jgi:N-acyl-L-homoserine lactone synthetase
MQPLKKPTETDSSDELLVHILEGFRFQVCRDPWQAAQALEVRRQVYLEDSGYEVPIPDEYDRRSWLITAEDLSTGKIVGSIRVTPRFAGPLEAEEYFTLPTHLRTPKAYEVSRFAILPGYRKGKTFLPVVSLGLFKTVQMLLERVGAQYMVICSKPERAWTFEWMRFEHTGLLARYEKLNNAEHALLTYDFSRERQTMADHPLRAYWLDIQYPQVNVPKRLPALGLGGETTSRYVRLAAVGA